MQHSLIFSLLVCVSITSLAMELTNDRACFFQTELQKMKKNLSVGLKIRKAKLKLAATPIEKTSPINQKVRKIKIKLATKQLLLAVAQFNNFQANRTAKKEEYEAILKELDPAKLWHGNQYLVTAHIKTDRYGQFPGNME